MILPDTYPDEPPNHLYCQELPQSSVPYLLSSNNNEEVGNKEVKEFHLSDLYSNFVQCVEKYRPLRRMLRDLDENTWVLDPPAGPARKSMEYPYRRVVISKGVSLHVDLMLENSINQLPCLKFLGCDEKIRPLREILSRNLENYDPDYTLVQNLESVLELEFPLQQDHPEGQVIFRELDRK